jgi:hypothetical protein
VILLFQKEKRKNKTKILQTKTHFLTAFQSWQDQCISEAASNSSELLNLMNYHHRRAKANEAERWEEHHRELQDPIGNTRPLRQREDHSYHSTMRNPGFGGPLSHHDRQASEVPSLVLASDAIRSEASRSGWMCKTSDHSSSSDRKLSSMSMPEVSKMPPQSSQPTIEISPGVHVRLRGADETWRAIANDFYMPAECICCESTIFCIQNADYVLCPDCRVVSRMDGLSSLGIGGVGLGFKYEDLARWQDQILRYY